jgi:hypothetical protein
MLLERCIKENGQGWGGHAMARIVLLTETGQGMTRHVLVSGLGKTWHDLCLSPGNRWKHDPKLET